MVSRAPVICNKNDLWYVIEYKTVALSLFMLNHQQIVVHIELASIMEIMHGKWDWIYKE